jgi:Flp pilus assembly protein TadD
MTWWEGFLAYLRVLVWPVHLSIVPELPIAPSFATPAVLAGGAAFLLIGAAAARLRKRRPIAAWSLVTFLASVAPLTNFVVPIRAAAGVLFPWAERFLFVPSIFAVLAAVGSITAGSASERPGRNRWLGALLVTFVVAFGARSVARQRVWIDQRTLFEGAVADAPNDGGAAATLGGALADAGDWSGAESRLRRAVAVAPGNVLAHFNLGNVLRHRNDLAGAAAEYEAAVAGNPQYPQAWLNLGLARVAQGRLDDAMAAFRSADAAMGGYAEAKFDMATLLRGTGRFAEAIPLYEEALRLDPSLSAARSGLEAARRRASAH